MDLDKVEEVIQGLCIPKVLDQYNTAFPALGASSTEFMRQNPDFKLAFGATTIEELADNLWENPAYPRDQKYSEQYNYDFSKYKELETLKRLTENEKEYYFREVIQERLENITSKLPHYWYQNYLKFVREQLPPIGKPVKDPKTLKDYFENKEKYDRVIELLREYEFVSKESLLWKGSKSSLSECLWALLEKGYFVPINLEFSDYQQMATNTFRTPLNESNHSKNKYEPNYKAKPSHADKRNYFLFIPPSESIK